MLRKLAISALLFSILVNTSVAKDTADKKAGWPDMPCLFGGCIDHGPAFIFQNMEVINGQFDCDTKNKENLCKLTYSAKFIQGYRTDLTAYCPINTDGSCPDLDACIDNEIPQTLNPDIVEATKIIQKFKLDPKNPEKTFNKISKSDAQKISKAITQLDVGMLKGLPAKNIKDIEEFKNLPLDQQTNIIMKPKNMYMAAAVVGGAVAAYYATGWVTKAYQDSLFGSDHLRKNKDKEIKKKMYDEKQFDLKD